MKQRILFLAFFIATVLPSLKAQDEFTELGKATFYGVECVHYKKGTEYYRRFNLSDGDFFYTKIRMMELNEAPAITDREFNSCTIEVDLSQKYKLTYNNAVIAPYEDYLLVGQIKGDTTTMLVDKTNLSLKVTLNASSTYVDRYSKDIKDKAYNDKGELVINPNYVVSEREICWLWKNNKKYSRIRDYYYDDYKYEIIWVGLECKNDSAPFYYGYNFEDGEIYRKTQKIVKCEQKNVFKEQLAEKSCEDFLEKYNINLDALLKEYAKCENQREKEDFVAYLLEINAASFLGFKGKINEKKRAKYNIDLTVLVDRCDQMVDSIVQSWYITHVDSFYFYYDLPKDDPIKNVKIEEYYHTINYESGDSVVLKHRYDAGLGDYGRKKVEKKKEYSSGWVFASYLPDVPQYVINDKFDFVSGTLTKNNGKLIYKSEEDAMLVLNEGNKFIPTEYNGFKESDWFRCSVLHPYNGMLFKTDGSSEAIKDGETESEKLAREEAEKRAKEKAEQARDAAYKKELVNTYGEHYAKAILNNEILVGMTLDMLFEMYWGGFTYWWRTSKTTLDGVVIERYALRNYWKDIYVVLRNGRVAEIIE